MNTVHLTLKSSNVKTGPMPVSTSGRQTCPAACNLRKNGCYADSGPLALHWDKVTSGERGIDWNSFCAAVAGFAVGQIWRMNQAGDLPHNQGFIDGALMHELITANKGKLGFTYTHHSVINNSHNQAIVKSANDNGFTINLSAENLDHADQLADLNIGPVVTIVPIDFPLKSTTNKGRTIVVCPATYRDNVSCFSCQLCQKQRDTIVAFPVHGTGKKKAHKVFLMSQI
jgi:hypothetical protein